MRILGINKRNSNLAIRRRKRKKRKKILTISVIGIFLIAFIGLAINYLKNDKSDFNIASDKVENESVKSEEVKLDKKEELVEVEPELPPKPVPIKEEILISAAGDCILGTDDTFGYYMSFPAMVDSQNGDYSYFFSNVKDIFGQDDYTIVNLENPLTDALTKAYKGEGRVFHFKGPAEYTNIFTTSSVEGVTIANNHIYDYGQEGYEDTIAALTEANVDYCGEGNVIIKEVKGIKIGFLAYTGWYNDEALKMQIKADIDALREQDVKVIIPYFHWGIEREYNPYEVQIDLAHYAIDNGADLVLGSHPHVIQSMENYKGKFIAYSFGNFSFGGNFNPEDKRTFILQIKFNFTDDSLVDYEVKVIPTSISSVDNLNDYRPTPMEGEAKAEFLKTINELSPTLNNSLTDEYFKLNDKE